MRKHRAAKMRRAVALLLLMAMCLGNITPALALEIGEVGAGLYANAAETLSSLLDTSQDDTSSGPANGPEGGGSDNDGPGEPGKESESGADDEETGSEETAGNNEDTNEENGAEDGDNPDDTNGNADGNADGGEGSEGSDNEGGDDGSAEPEEPSEPVDPEAPIEPEEPFDPENPEGLPEDELELQLMADMLDAAPVPVSDLDGLIAALETDPQPEQINLLAAIRLNDQGDVDDLNGAIAGLTGEVTLTVDGAFRHFIIQGDVEILTLGENVILDGGGEAGGIEINYVNTYTGEFTLAGGSIQNCQAASGGAIQVTNSQLLTVTLEKTQVTGNSLTASGQGVGYFRASGPYNNLAKTIFNEVCFAENVGPHDPYNPTGTVVIRDNNHLIVKDSVFRDNDNYYGVFMATLSGSIIEVEDSSFTGNRGERYGAVVYVSGNTNSTFSNVTFTDNRSKESEGGVLYATKGTHTFNNCTFQNNFAQGYGGALYLSGTSGAIVNGGTFEGNSGQRFGGAIYCASTGPFTVSGAVFSNNYTFNTTTSDGGGGAIAIVYTILPAGNSISDCEFFGNHSGGRNGNGGALFLQYNVNNGFTLGGKLVFEGNSAEGLGGAIFTWENLLPALLIDDDSEFYFSNNVANGAYWLTEAHKEAWKDYPILTTDAIRTLSDPFDAEMDSVLNNYDLNYTNNENPQYQIKYDLNGASGNTYSELWDKGEIITIEDPADLNYTMADHVFTGWNTAADGSAVNGWYQPGDTYTLNSNLTLYAQWSPKVDVTFYWNRPDDVTESVYLPLERAEGGSVSPEEDEDYADPELTGYRFDGWATDPDGQVEYEPGDVIALTDEDLDLYAVWTKILIINYFNGDKKVEFQDYAGLDDEVTIAAYPTETGKLARIWDTEAQGGGTEYEEGETFTLAEVDPELEELNLYIQWITLTDQVVVSLLNGPVAEYGLLGWYEGTGVTGSDHTYFTMLAGEAAEITTAFQVTLGDAAGERNADVYLAFEADPEVSGRTVTFTAPAALEPYVQSGGVDAGGKLLMTVGALNTSDEYEAAAYADLKSKGFTDDAYYLLLSGEDFAGIRSAVGTTFPVTAQESIAAGDVEYAEGVGATSLSYNLKAVHHTVNLPSDIETAATGYSFLAPKLGLDLSYDLDPDSAVVGETITVTLTARNLSNIGLQDVVLTILKGSDEATAEPFDAGLLSDLSISYTPYGSSTLQDLGPVSGHAYTIDYWDGSLIPDAHGENHENGIYTITFTYEVQAEDVEGQDAEGSSFNVPFFITLSGRTPELSLDQAAVADGEDFDQWYTGQNLIDAVEGKPELYDEATPSLGIGSATITYDANGGSGSHGNSVNVSGLVTGSSYKLLDYTDSALDFSRNYHEFLGWTTEKDWDPQDIQDLLDAGDAVTVADGTTYYAQWKALNYPVTYVLNPDPALGESDKQETDETDRYVVNATVSVKDNIFTVADHPFLSEYTFLGWTKDAKWDGDEAELLNPPATVLMEEGGVTLYAQWQRRTYTVTYDANHPLVTGENSIYTDPATYTSVQNITVLSNMFPAGSYPGLEEYEFLGWTTLEDPDQLIQPDATMSMGSGDRTFYAKWEQKTYQIAYHSNYQNGDPNTYVLDPEQYGKGDSVTLYDADTFTVTNYGLLSWNTEAGGGGTSYAPGEVITMGSGNMNLYAQWAQGSVYYDLNHDSFSAAERITEDGPYGAGSKVQLVQPSLTLTNHRFLGWSKTADNSEKEWLQPGEELTVPEGSVTLYAQWQSEDVTETTVEYHANDGSGRSTSETLPIGSFVVILPNDFEREEHIFLGWNTRADGTGTGYSYGDTVNSLPAQGLILYAQWEEITYSLSFAANETQYPGLTITGSTAAQQHAKEADVVIPDSGYIAAHYTFLGWNTEADGSGDTYLPDSSFTMPGEAVTLYAQWRHDTYTVTYHSGYVNGPEAVTDASFYESGEQITVESGSLFARDGYTFAGWALSEAEEAGELRYDPADPSANTFVMPAEDVDLYARWDLIYYTVIYEINDSGNVITPITERYPKYEKAAVIANSHTHSSGLEFLGWNTAANGSGIWYQPEHRLTVLGDMTFYAQWGDTSSITTVTIQYIPNGADSPAAAHSETAAPGVAHTVLAPSDSSLNYAKTDYVFLGWNADPDGAGAWYTAGADLTVPYHDVTLYAQWEKESHDVIYLANRFEGDTVTRNDRYEVNTAFLAAGNPFVKEDYHFVGWNTETNGGGQHYEEGDSLTMGKTDILLYAQWEENTYTVTYDSNRGDGVTIPDGAEYPRADKVTLPDGTIFAYADVVFLGWSWEPNDPLTQWLDSGDQITMPAKDVTLYAQWKDISATTTNVTYLPGEGVGAAYTEALETGTSYSVRGASDSRLSYTKANSQFKGWATKADGTGTFYTAGEAITVPVKDLVLYAQWETVAVTVTYEPNNGASDPAHTVIIAIGGGHTVEDAAALGFEKNGHRFLGFNTAADATGDWYQPGQEMTSLSEDVTLYAIYSSEQAGYHLLLYSANADYYGWDSYEGTVVDAQNPYYAGTSIDILKNGYTKDGYKFLGWSTSPSGGGTLYVAADETGGLTGQPTIRMGNITVTLYAQWEDLNPVTPEPETFTVTYNANGGSGTVTDNAKYETGDTVTVKNNSFTKNNHDFVEFNTKEDGTGTAYEPGDTFAMGSENVILFAIWKETTGNGNGSSGKNKGGSGVSTYTVTYRSEYAGARPTDGSYQSGTSVTVKAHSVFTDAELPEGAEFLGWSLTGSEVDYKAGDKLTITANITLYAVYDKTNVADGENGNNNGEDMSSGEQQQSKVAELLNVEDHLAYISGYPDGTVRPQANITREEVTAIFYRLLNSGSKSRYEASASSFYDVESGRWSESAIATMNNAGILSGDVDGGFRPADAITRAEAAVIAAKFTDGTHSGSDKFTDISGHWAAGYINTAAELGWMTGGGDGSFRPDEYITRAEVMAMINTMLGRTPQSAGDLNDNMLTFRDNSDTSAWYYLHVQEATNSHYYVKSSSGRENWTELR